jgi:hypothetical protein
VSIYDIYAEDLKPCPFCGGKARIKQGAGRYRIMCTAYCVQTVDAFATLKSAIYYWNRRVTNPNEYPSMEEVRKGT